MTLDYGSQILDHLGWVASVFDELGLGEGLDEWIPQDVNRECLSGSSGESPGAQRAIYCRHGMSFMG